MLERFKPEIKNVSQVLRDQSTSLAERVPTTERQIIKVCNASTEFRIIDVGDVYKVEVVGQQHWIV